MERIKKSDKKLLAKRVATIATIVALLLAIGYGVWSDNTVRSLNRQVESLNGVIKTNNDKNKKTSDENVNLKNAVKTLQAQIDASKQSTSQQGSEPKSKLIVSKVGYRTFHLYPEDYSWRGTGIADLRDVVVEASITNISDINQAYSTANFYATSDSGKIVRPEKFVSPALYGLWSQTELAPGGSENIVVVFPSDQNLVTLTMNVPGTDKTLTVALPPAA